VTYDDHSTSTDGVGVTWKSSNEKIATVDSNGLVTGVAKGTCTISASMGNKVGDYALTVVKNKPVTGISLNPTSLSVQVGQSAYVSAQVIPSDASKLDVTFKSLNESVATVTQNGQVTGVTKGKTTITVTSVSNPEVYANCEVEVTDPVKATGISSISVGEGANKVTVSSDEVYYELEKGKSVNLTAKLTPSDSVISTIKWSCNDADGTYIKVDKDTGVVTAVGAYEENVDVINPAKVITVTATLTSVSPNRSKSVKIKPIIIAPVRNLSTVLSGENIVVSWAKATAGGDHYWVTCKDKDGKVVYETHVDDISTTTATIPAKEGSTEILKHGNPNPDTYTIYVKTTIGLNELNPKYKAGPEGTIQVKY
jgi:uncharacterized protein YjdB